jgi:hypothetical protein
MEKSLVSIEKALGSAEKAGKAASPFASLASSLSLLIGAASSKSFNEKKADSVLNFSKGLISVVNTVDEGKAKSFTRFTESFSKSMETMVELMSPIRLLKLSLAAKVLFEGKKPLLKRIAEGISNSFEGVDTKKVKQGSEALKMMGEGLLSLTKAMKSLILIGIAAPLVLMGALVTRGVIALFTSLGKKAKEIEDGGKAIRYLGRGLLYMAAGIAAMVLVTLVASPKAIIGAIAIIALFALTFYTLGKAAPSIMRGVRALAYMGLALFGFTMGLATYMLAMLVIPPLLIVQGIATIAGFAVVFALLGIDKVSQAVAQGALLLIGMAVALFLFSGGLMIYGLALKLFTWESMLMGAALIAEIGLAMAILGRFSKQISSGAIVMAEMGIGLAFFSVGLLIFGLAVKLFDLESILIGAGLIVGIGLATSIVGYLAQYITPGALALAEMGIGLAFFSVGVLIFGLAVKLFDLETILIGTGLIVGFGLAMALIGTVAAYVAPGAIVVAAMGIALTYFSVGVILFGLAVKGIIALFADDPQQGIIVAAGVLLGLGLAFAAIGLLAAPIMLGAESMLMVGVSLIFVSVGIIIFALAIKALTALFDDLTEAGKIAGGILLGLGLAFSALGLMSPAIALGSVSAILIGVSLIIFSVGLMLFGLALKMLDKSGLIVKDGDSYTLKGISILSNLSIEISKVGLIAGLNPFFYLGINSSLMMAYSLTAIGIGLMAAAEALKNVPDMKKLTDAVFGDGGLVHSMAESFAKIGKKYGGFSALLGVDDVSMGVMVTKDFGEVLQELAGGIVAFADFTQFPVKVPDPKDPSRLVYTTVDIFGEIIPKLNANLPTLLSTLATTFAEIGSTFGGGDGWFGSDSPVQKGIDAVKGLGSVLSELAGGMVAFANFEEFPIQIPDPKDPSKLVYKAVNMFDVIPKIKTALVGDGMQIQGKLTPKSGILFALAEVFAEIGSKYEGDGFFSDNKVKAGVDAVQGIGSVVVDLAEGIVAFANMNRGLPNYDEKGKFNGTFTPFKVENIAANISKVLNSLPSAFANIDIKKMEAAQEKAEVAIPLANAISKIGKSLQDLMVEKSKDEKTNLLSTIGPSVSTIITAFSTMDLKKMEASKEKADLAADLAKAVSKVGKALQELMVDKGDKEKVNLLDIIGPSLSKFVDATNSLEIDSSKIANFNELSEVLIKLSKVGDSLKIFAESLAATGDSFKKFSSGFGTFSSQLEKFIRFEQAFSNLVRNQYTYKFDKFAESMGVLKSNVNAFDLEKLKFTDSLMKSLAVLSKQPEDIGKDIKDSIEKAFQALAKALEKMISEMKASNEATTAAVTAATTTTSAAASTAAAKPGAAKAATTSAPTPATTSTDITGLTRELNKLVVQLSSVIDAGEQKMRVKT